MASPSPPLMEGLSFSTTLNPGSFLKFSVVLGLLNIITLTLWRFWGKTEVRRRIWRDVQVNGDAFEYTGRGVELFIGFILALAVLGLPFLVVVFGAQLLDPVITLLILLPLYGVMFWLWGFGLFTAYRYLASRTTWRGIRFQLKGSAVRYANRFLTYVVLNGVTLGWFKPEADRLLSDMTWGNLFLGDKPLHFRIEQARKQPVYGWFALGWFGQALGYVLFAVTVFWISMAMTGADPTDIRRDVEPPAEEYVMPLQAEADRVPPDISPQTTSPEIIVKTVPADDTGDVSGEDDPVAAPPPDWAMVAAFYGAMLLVAPIWFLIWGPYNAAILRSIVGGIGFDKAHFKLRVGTVSLWWLTITNLLFLLISVGFLMPWIQARSVRYVVRRLQSTGDVDLSGVEQASRGPRAGEGLADAFGFSLI